MKNGLLPIKPHTKDYSLIHTFGAVGLPDSFSIYEGQTIPNQELPDTRFTPNLIPLPFGCTGETAAFDSGMQDSKLYSPQYIYANTPPKDSGGRDIRDVLQFLIDNGPEENGTKRLAYFNCYGSGAIDDFDAARIGVYINQSEKRGVWIGSYWYWGDEPPSMNLSLPSFIIAKATLHCYLCTGWNEDGLELIPWLGENYGDKGKFYVSREIFNALMAQPFSAAFTITKVPSNTPVPIGFTAIVDHLTYLIRQLFRL